MARAIGQWVRHKEFSWISLSFIIGFAFAFFVGIAGRAAGADDAAPTRRLLPKLSKKNPPSKPTSTTPSTQATKLALTGKPTVAQARPAASKTIVPVSAHPLDPALALVRQCQERFQSVRDYSATFVKQERIGDELHPVTYIQAKFRNQPFSVYFRFIEPDAGNEAIFVEGENDNKILSHTTGLTKVLTGTVKLDPEGKIARKGNRHSIREAGIGNLIDRLIERWEFERQFNETQVTIANKKINDQPCYLIHAVHPMPDAGRYMYHSVKVYIDKGLMLPIRIEGYEYPRAAGPIPGPMVECYTYLNLELNAGFSDVDFSPRNPEYGFARF